mgnify:CR=1 FL=1
MANMEERLQAVVSQAEADGEKWHTIIHGNIQQLSRQKTATFQQWPNN